MEILVKPEILTSYIYTYIYKDLRLATLKAVFFLFAAQCFNTESMQKVILCHSCV
jgi:hypothetical protein